MYFKVYSFIWDFGEILGNYHPETGCVRVGQVPRKMTEEMKKGWQGHLNMENPKPLNS